MTRIEKFSFIKISIETMLHVSKEGLGSCKENCVANDNQLNPMTPVTRRFEGTAPVLWSGGAGATFDHCVNIHRDAATVHFVRRYTSYYEQQSFEGTAPVIRTHLQLTEAGARWQHL